MTQPIKLLVIGGVAAGASCAARARRLCETAEITVIERGPDVSFANCGLPYHIGGEIPTRDVLPRPITFRPTEHRLSTSEQSPLPTHFH